MARRFAKEQAMVPTISPTAEFSLSLSLSHGTFCGLLKYLGSNQMSRLCIILEGAANYSVVDGPVQELMRTSATHFL